MGETYVNVAGLIVTAFFVVLVGAVVVYTMYVRRRAGTTRKRTAVEYGDMRVPDPAAVDVSLNSSVSNPQVLTTRFTEFFATRHDRRIENGMHAQIDGRDAAIFDVAFRPDDDDHDRWERLSCARTATSVRGPCVRAMPRDGVSVLDVRLKTIHLESDDFERAFRVQAGDQRFAFEVFSPSLMTLFLAEPRLCGSRSRMARCSSRRRCARPARLPTSWGESCTSSTR